MSEKRWKRNPHVVARRIGDDTILVPVGKDAVNHRCLFTLNDTGSFIWESLASPSTLSQIGTALVEAFDVPAEQAREDLGRFLDELAGKGCILEESGEEDEGGA